MSAPFTDTDWSNPFGDDQCWINNPVRTLKRVEKTCGKGCIPLALSSYLYDNHRAVLAEWLWT